MQLDREFLRRHYAEMSDEELFSLDREDLVEAARQIFDEEVRNRQRSTPERRPAAVAPLQEDAEMELDWLEDAAEAYSRYVTRGTEPAPEAVQAREVLEDARIPTHLELCEEPGQDDEMQYRWRVLVPGKWVHRAISVLDRDIFNPEFESQWRAHLEMLTDQDLRVMEPHFAFCGLYDRIERINRAYEEELGRRGLKD